MEDYQKILELLLTLEGSKRVNEGQIKMHCPVCNKPDNKLYVGLTHNPFYTSKGVKALGYGCKQCQFSGMVGKRFFQTLGIQYDKNLIKFDLPKNNILKSVGAITKFEKLDLKIPNFIRPEDEFKVKYLEGRFGRKITMKDIQHYKIVLNFNDLFTYNKIDLCEYEDKSDKERCRKLKYMAEEYTKHFVGLLSVDNNKVNLRNINSQKFANKRYMVHVINKNIGNPYMYMPSSELNLLATIPTICMAEGNYDIIGAKELYFKDERNDMLFVAIGTRTAYKRALNQIMKMTGWLTVNINVFADNDKDTNLDWYRDMFKDFRPLINKLTVNYNVAVDAEGKPCKDFGNLSNPVQLEVHEI